MLYQTALLKNNFPSALVHICEFFNSVILMVTIVNSALQQIKVLTSPENQTNVAGAVRAPSAMWLGEAGEAATPFSTVSPQINAN